MNDMILGCCGGGMPRPATEGAPTVDQQDQQQGQQDQREQHFSRPDERHRMRQGIGAGTAEQPAEQPAEVEQHDAPGQPAETPADQPRTGGLPGVHQPERQDATPSPGTVQVGAQTHYGPPTQQT